MKYEKSLDDIGWSKHYNINLLNSVVASIEKEDVQIWAKELLKLISDGKSVLEIGCGTGISTLWLAKNGRKAYALDYTDSSVELVKEAAKRLKLDVDVKKADATKDLPYEKKQFEVIFQSGLLEHFSTEEQIKLLNSWKKYSKYMISMIPNKASLPYRVGKYIMEENKTWEYGLEIPKHSMIYEFEKAGIIVEREYTIGTEWALRFLPKEHYIKRCFEQLINEGYDLDEMMQGYLLVTIGKCGE